MNQNQKSIVFSILAGSLMLALAILISFRTPAGKLGDSFSLVIYGSAVNTSVSVTSTPTLILSANTGRTTADICNPSTNSSNIWLSEFIGGVTPTTTVGAANRLATGTGRLLPNTNTCYTIRLKDNLTGNAIWGISNSIASSSSPVSVKETSQ